MQNLKKALLILAFVFVPVLVYAAPSYIYQKTILPEVTNTYDLGGTSNYWRNLYTNQVCLAGDCKTVWPTGSGGAFPFTPQSWGNSTSTTIGFTNGILSNASSTFSATSTFSRGLTVGTGYGLQFIGYSAIPQVFAGDPTSGLHFDGPGIVSFHNGGTQTMLLSSTNNVGIGSSSPSQRLSVQGNGLFSGNLATAGLTATGTITFSGLSNGLIKSTSGVLSAATAGTDYENPLTFSYPLVRSANTISLAFGTTTANTWSAANNFTSTLAVGSSTPWGLFSVNPNALGSGVPEFVIGSSSATHLVVDGAGRVGIGTLTPGYTLDINGNARVTGSGGLALNAAGNASISADVGGSTYLAAASGKNEYFQIGGAYYAVLNSNGLAINNGSTPAGSGVGLTVATGNVGIGTTSPTQRLSVQGDGLFSGNLSVAGIIATGTATVGNLISSGLTANSFIYANGSKQLATGSVSSPLVFSSGTLSLGTVGVANGGTGSTTLSGILAGNGTSGVKTAVIGSGLTWDGTTLSASGSSGVTSIQQSFGTAQTGAITLATSSAVTSNGVTVGQTITNSAGTFTFTPTVSVSAIPNAALANSSITVSNGGGLTVSGSPVSLGGTVTISLNTGNANTWTGLQAFNGNASTTQLSVYNKAYFGATATTTISNVGWIGVASSTPWGALSVNPTALGSGVPEFVVGSSTTTHLLLDGAGRLGIGTTSPWSNLSIDASAGVTPFAVGSSTKTLFSINNLGKTIGYDIVNAWSGVLSPTRALSLQTGTTTTWTATSTGAGVPQAVAPFAGTIQNVRCKLDASFLGVNIQINGSDVTPNYFVASTTVGKVGFTAGNTFNAGDVITANIGTTTTASATRVSCTLSLTETP